MTQPTSSLGKSWQRDQPDLRDYTPEHPDVREMLERLKRPRSRSRKLPAQVDLTEFFPEIVARHSLPISTSHACCALVEYFDRRTLGRITTRSPLFLYKMALKLASPAGQAGTDIRTTLKALARFGLPPERYWPSEESRFDNEPDPSLYWLGEQFRSIRYFRLDSRNSNGVATLDTVRFFLAAGFPCVLGFSAPESISDEPDIPYNPATESICEGHAAVAVGYDDRRLTVTRGSLLIRCSVGVTWNHPEYRWLPYRYVEEQLAVDFWTLLRDGWLDSGELRYPHFSDAGGARDEPSES